MENSWTTVDAYLAAACCRQDPALDAALAANAAAGLPAIDVSPAGQAPAHPRPHDGARRILEIGTLGGYSTIWLARALPRGRAAGHARGRAEARRGGARQLARAGLADRVEVIVGPALDTLPRLTGPFDLVFIDADKRSNADYLGGGAAAVAAGHRHRLRQRGARRRRRRCGAPRPGRARNAAVLRHAGRGAAADRHRGADRGGQGLGRLRDRPRGLTAFGMASVRVAP